MITLTDKQIEDLHHTSCQSFFNEQRDRFEIYLASFSSNTRNTEEFSDEDWHFRFYNTRIEALFAYNYFSQETETMLLWDMGKEEWCVFTQINNVQRTRKKGESS